MGNCPSSPHLGIPPRFSHARSLAHILQIGLIQFSLVTHKLKHRFPTHSLPGFIGKGVRVQGCFHAPPRAAQPLAFIGELQRRRKVSGHHGSFCYYLDTREALLPPAPLAVLVLRSGPSPGLFRGLPRDWFLPLCPVLSSLPDSGSRVSG